MKNLFEECRVVDFTTNYAGPLATCYLSDFGAEVIKIEKPDGGDDSRRFSPWVDGVGVPYMWVNRGKKSLVLDMNDPEGREAALKLVAVSDVVVESFKPGTMKKFGMDYETLKRVNPRLIMCSVSAFGQTGPRWEKPGYDIIIQALSGLMDVTGEPDGPPTRAGFAIADYVGGIHAFAAIASALYCRERTGKGQYIDISLFDCLTSFNGTFESAGLGKRPARSGKHHTQLVPFGLFEGTGGSIVIGATNDRLWKALCKVMGRKDMLEDPDFKTLPDRLKNLTKVVAAIEGWLKTFDNIDEPLLKLEEGGIPCARVNTTNDLLDDAQLKAREMIIELETPDGVSVRKIKARGNPFKFSETSPVLRKSPALGQHTAEILRLIGYTDEEIARLKSKWNIA